METLATTVREYSFRLWYRRGVCSVCRRDVDNITELLTTALAGNQLFSHHVVLTSVFPLVFLALDNRCKTPSNETKYSRVLSSSE